MTSPRERFDYSAMPSRRPLRLPGGARVAVVVVVNVEDFEAPDARQMGHGFVGDGRGAQVELLQPW